MSPRGVPRTGLYLFCTACGLFATALAPQLYGMALVGPLGPRGLVADGLHLSGPAY